MCEFNDGWQEQCSLDFQQYLSELSETTEEVRSSCVLEGAFEPNEGFSILNALILAVANMEGDARLAQLARDLADSNYEYWKKVKEQS